MIGVPLLQSIPPGRGCRREWGWNSVTRSPEFREYLVRRRGQSADLTDAVRLAEALEAPAFSTRQIFPNFPTRHPLYCGMYPVSKEFERITGLKPDVVFLAGVQGVH